MNFLLIDDDEVFASVLRRALSRRGYCAHWAADGEAALAALKETAPSHIVLDLNLGGEVRLRNRAGGGVEATVILPWPKENAS